MQVRFNEYRFLAAHGSLVAVGTANQPIVFTAATGSGVSGYWNGITIGGGSVSDDSDSSRLSYVYHRGRGLFLQWTGPLSPALHADPGFIRTIRNSGGDGLWARPYRALHARFGDHPEQRRLWRLCPDRRQRNAHRQSTITGNAVATRLPADVVLQNVTWTNNTRNEIEFIYAITHDVTWTSRPSPTASSIPIPIP